MKKLCLIFGLLVLFSGTLIAQKTITGTVVDKEGETLIGATILVKGSSVGTVTDFDGKYSIELPEDGKILVFSYTGFSTTEIEVGISNVLDVTLESSASLLGEVVVLGYSTRGKNQITGSTVQVSGTDLKDVPVVSVDQALQGKVPGLVISSSSGTPGATQDIRIRGVGSISAGNSPLFVIDGVPVVNDNFSGSTARSSLSALAAVNNGDIESITVLKDASATSAYGARGSNGVIVITTKKGKSGKTNFNLSISRGFQSKATEGRDVLTAAQREELYLEGIYNSRSEGGTLFTKEETFDWALNEGYGGAAIYNQWREDGKKEGNWQEAIENENAPVTNINLSASGGDETSSFYASLSYNETESVVVGNKFNRYSGSLNYDRKLTDKIQLSTNNSMTKVIQDGIFLEQSAYFANPHMTKWFMNPTDQPYDEKGEANTNLNSSIFNYLYLKDNDIDDNNLNRLRSNSYLSWDIMEDLKFKTLVGMDYNEADYTIYQNRNYGGSLGENGYAYNSIRKNFNIVTQNSLDYKLKLPGTNHRVDFKALMEFQKNNSKFLFGSGENFPTDGLTYISQAGANQDAGSSFTDWINLSYLGMANYNYQGKYIVDLTFRREGSSRFAPDLRYGNFWSIGAAWNISEEAFMDGMSWIDILRLRATYGISGNSAVGINKYQALLAYDADYAGQGAVYPSEYGNSNLTWEKNKNYDIGIDFGVFNNRIDGQISYFNKQTFDLLQPVPLTRTSGHSEIIQNIGTVVNKGLEAILNFGIVRTKDLNIELSLNFATLDNEVIALAQDAGGEDINIETGSRIIEVGYPIYTWNMREYAGVNPETGAPQWYVNSGEGDQMTEVYSDAEKVHLNTSAIPKFTGGASFHIDFKGLYFDINAYYAGGHQVYEDWAFYTWHSGRYTTDYYQGVADLMNRWQQPGDITDVPRQVHDNTGHNASSTSTRFLFDGDYARIKDMVLGYNIPEAIAAKVKMNGIQVYVRGTNLFTWVKDENLKYDPEVTADGFTSLTTPPIKSISVGLNLKF
jgi:TonB-linked SusC/RagA family outer membrane protein